jgi:transaldolase
MNDIRPSASCIEEIDAPGQQLWLDQLGRELIASGTLAAWIADDGVQGLALTPVKFLDAIRSDAAYQAALPALRTAPGDPEARLQALVLPELRRACALFAAQYEASDGKAGLVSVALPPRLAHDAAATVAAARALWSAIGAPNAMVMLPATEAGIAALEQLIFDGINVDMTLIFGPRQLAAVRAAHRRGLARRLEAKLSIQRIASIASVSISRIDAAVDALLPPSASHLQGKAGVAAARLAWRDNQGHPAFAVFAAFGASVQRLRWDSTDGVDAATYRAALAGPDTIQTLPAATVREHAAAAPALSQGAGQAEAVLLQLARHGIELDTIGNALLLQGLTQFEQAHAQSLALLE